MNHIAFAVGVLAGCLVIFLIYLALFQADKPRPKPPTLYRHTDPWHLLQKATMRAYRIMEEGPPGEEWTEVGKRRLVEECLYELVLEEVKGYVK